MKNKKADVRQEVTNEICYVYVIDKDGKRCFCREKTKQTLAIAHAIYMCEKYGERYDVIKLENLYIA